MKNRSKIGRVLHMGAYYTRVNTVPSDSCVFESVSYTYIKPVIICLAFLVTFCLFFQDARPEWFLVSHMILDRNLKDSLRCSRLIMLRLTPTGFDSSVEATKTIICLNGIPLHRGSPSCISLSFP